MIREQLTMATVYEAFVKYLEGRTSQPIDVEWKKFKSLLLTRMTEGATKRDKEHG
jgi:hypothetical protein